MTELIQRTGLANTAFGADGAAATFRIVVTGAAAQFQRSPSGYRPCLKQPESGSQAPLVGAGAQPRISIRGRRNGKPSALVASRRSPWRAEARPSPRLPKGLENVKFMALATPD